jgi:predicted GNAT family acetyltransferase
MIPNSTSPQLLAADGLVIRHEAGDNSGSFIAERDTCAVGSLTYRGEASGEMRIESVFVSPEARGGLIARALVEASVRWADLQNALVVAECEYARVLLQPPPVVMTSVPSGPKARRDASEVPGPATKMSFTSVSARPFKRPRASPSVTCLS